MTEKSHPSNCGNPVASGTLVRTACGGVTYYSMDMPCAEFLDHVIYFCLPECKRDFEKDPHTSCLASRMAEFE